MTTRILTGDCRELLATLPEQSVQCVVTSPPYFGLRDYNVAGQIGLEPTLAGYIAEMVGVFRSVRHVLRDDGTVWLNCGDSYAAGKSGRTDHGSDDPTVRLSGNTGGAVAPGPVIYRKATDGLKPKDLMMVPSRLAIALCDDGWYLRSDIIWAKPNPMPESVTDRPTSAHEHIFLLTKQARYYYDADAIAESSVEPDRIRNDRIGGANGHTVRHSEGGMMQGVATRNARNVWTIPTSGFSEAHFAVMPAELARRCILAGSREGDTVLDPFAGAGTTLLVADRLGRNGIGIELNPEYAEMARRRIINDAPLFAGVPFEPIAKVSDKQAALGKQTYTGFNQRWNESNEDSA